jgi:hypothetical protein
VPTAARLTWYPVWGIRHFGWKEAWTESKVPESKREKEGENYRNEDDGVKL